MTPTDNICNRSIITQPCLIPLSFFQTSDWVDIQVISTAQGKMTVRMAGKDMALAQAVYNKDDFKEYYIGGAPQDLRERC